MPKRKMNQTNSNDSEKKSKPNTFWALGLLNAMDDPDLKVFSDDEVVVIKDKYPKAKFHYLVLPKENISDLKKVDNNHVELLKHMDDVGRKVVEDEIKEGHMFKFGYHARASMQRLHLHVISNDMISSCLKTKKHWISFTSDFFMDSKDVQEDLQKNGKVTLPSDVQVKKYFELPLQCHKCKAEQKNMPTLKKHIETCKK